MTALRWSRVVAVRNGSTSHAMNLQTDKLAAPAETGSQSILYAKHATSRNWIATGHTRQSANMQPPTITPPRRKPTVGRTAATNRGNHIPTRVQRNNISNRETRPSRASTCALLLRASRSGPICRRHTAPILPIHHPIIPLYPPHNLRPCHSIITSLLPMGIRAPFRRKTLTTRRHTTTALTNHTPHTPIISHMVRETSTTVSPYRHSLRHIASYR